MRRIGLSTLVFMLLLPAALSLSQSAAAGDTAEKSPDGLSIRVKKDLISITAKDVPLEAVFNELSRKGLVKVISINPSVSGDILSFSYSQLKPFDTVSSILKNYNFTMFEEGGKPTVSIMGSLHPETSSPIMAAPVKARDVPVTEREPGAKRPESLDDCVPLDYTERDAMRDMEDVYKLLQGGEGRVPTSKESQEEFQSHGRRTQETEQRLSDARIKRAKEVLAREACSNLWGQAIDELAVTGDASVPPFLANLAKEGQTGSLRRKAAEGLWRSTAKSGFMNTTGIELLKELSESKDSDVSSVAQRALHDYEKHLKRNN